MRIRVPVVVVVSAAALLLSACSDGTSDSPPAASTSTAVVTETTTATGGSASAAPSGTSAPTASVLPVKSEASPGASVSVVDVRVGAHDDFDRVVFEFAGEGTPGWTIDYTDDPRHDGSGDPVELAGDGVIQVLLTGVGYPDDVGHPWYSGANPVKGTGAVTEVQVDGPFEAMASSFIGTTQAKPKVRVTSMSSPSRLVVDVLR